MQILALYSHSALQMDDIKGEGHCQWTATNKDDATKPSLQRKEVDN
jgi:hypothetical protein